MAKEAFKAAEKEYHFAAKKWAKVQAKALAEIAKLEGQIDNLKQRQNSTNPYSSQEDSEEYWDEIPHAIHALEVKVEKIKAQLNA